jgi:hypothetical protein
VAVVAEREGSRLVKRVPHITKSVAPRKLTDTLLGNALRFFNREA